MEHHALLSKSIVADLDQRSSIIEKVGLAALAAMLLALAFIDLRINDRFDSPFAAAHGGSLLYTGHSPYDISSIFNFQERQGKEAAQVAAARYMRSLPAVVVKNSKAPVMKLAASAKPVIQNKPHQEKVQSSLKKGYESPTVHAAENIGIAAEAGISQSGLYGAGSRNLHMNGWQAGIVLDVPLGAHAAFQPGIRYSVKGCETIGTTVVADISTTTMKKTMLSYVEAPLNVAWKCGDAGKTRFIAGGGPYVAYLAQTRSAATVESTGNLALASARTSPARLGEQPQVSTGNMRSMDYGVGGFVGCQTPGGFYVKAGAEAGLRSLTTVAGSGCNYNMGVSVGYMVGSR